jgi:DnaJ-domain-containing protein 1
MIWLTGFFAITVAMLLWVMLRAEYQNTRRDRSPYQCLETAGRMERASAMAEPVRSRVEKALRHWTHYRAASELSAPVRAVATEPAPALPAPEPQAPIDSHDPEHKKMETKMETDQMTAEAPAQRPRVEQSKGPENSKSAPTVDEGGAKNPPMGDQMPQITDYYECLQISPHADMETIHRVYRIMAARFHPDNPKTGSVERFLLLREAYEVLTDPERRAQYDASLQIRETKPLPIFELKAFVDGIEGEMNRRLGVLSLLYHKRRVCETSPGISVLELEKRMAFPREYLNFTLWYLRSKAYITVIEDNSDYSLTALGVDYVEARSSTNKVIRELLTAGSVAGSVGVTPAAEQSASAAPAQDRDQRGMDACGGLHR